MTMVIDSKQLAINGTTSLTGGEQRAIILKSAQDAGLSWGGNFSKPDFPHFYVDPGGRTAKIIDAQKTYCQISGGCK